MKTIFTLCTCIITILFFSCQREPLDVLPEEETPPPVDPATCVLDTFQVDMKFDGHSFVLSPKKKLNFTTIQYIDSSDNNLKIIDSLVFNEQKKLIKRYRKTSDGSVFLDSSLIELFYNTQGALIKKLYIQSNTFNPLITDTVISTYHYTDNRLSYLIKHTTRDLYRNIGGVIPPGVTLSHILSDSIRFTWTGQNISNLKEYTRVSADLPNMSFVSGDDISFEYDLSKTNPYSLHTPFVTFMAYNDLFSVSAQDIAWGSKNLIKKIIDNRRHEPNWEDIASFTYYYTYNDKNEIIKIYMKSDSNLDIEEHSYSFTFFPKCQ